jgi:hypothetical protein
VVRAGALAGLVAALTSCASYQMVRDTRDRQAWIDREIVEFYENVAHAYSLVGWEYYELAQKLKEEGAEEKSQEYAAKAYILTEFSRELLQNASAAKQAGAAVFSLPSATGTP